MRSIDFPSSFIYSPKQRRHQGQTSVVDAPDVRCILSSFIYTTRCPRPQHGAPALLNNHLRLRLSPPPPRQSGSSIYIYIIPFYACAPTGGPGALRLSTPPKAPNARGGSGKGTSLLNPPILRPVVCIHTSPRFTAQAMAVAGSPSRQFGPHSSSTDAVDLLRRGT